MLIFWVVIALYAPTFLCSLPTTPEVIAGEATVLLKDAQSVEIITSKKAILNFESFGVGKEESVRFIQPTRESCVLSRVVGRDPSQIFGRVDANGNLFLVNPNGIYFGPDSAVNAGSFVASTLGIRDEDFLAGNYHFLNEGNTGSILNEGLIGAEGFIALLGSVVQNQGKVIADADKVVIGVGEKITLDFTGDGLLQFTVEGDLERALLENYGQIAGKGVELTLRTARKALLEVVNTDGIEMAAAIEESNGVIRLVGSIAGKEVLVESERIDARGKIDASTQEMGGSVKLLGTLVELSGIEIDASGKNGGGTVLLGGNYQGNGIERNAIWTSMDEHSVVRADAYMNGDGGKVILWADHTAFFDGKIYAQGGQNSGNGGFVETSGKENLQVLTGYVNTSAANGRLGSWLLDPASIVIGLGGADTINSASIPNCADAPARSISVATMQAAVTDIALCAQNTTTSSITINSAFTLASGVSLTMTAGSTNVGPINLNANIATQGRPISMIGNVVLGIVGIGWTIDTTAGGNPAGASISFSGTVNGAQKLTLAAGTGGIISFGGAVGNTTAPLNLVFSSADSIHIGANLTVSSLGSDVGLTPLVFPRPVLLTGNSIISTNARNDINVNNTIDGMSTLSVRASGFTVNLSGVIGGITPVLSFSTLGALTNLGNNITTNGGAITFPAASLVAPVTLNTTGNMTPGGNITFNTVLNGAGPLTTIAGIGVVNFNGTIGTTTPPSDLIFTSAGSIRFTDIIVTGANPLIFPWPVTFTAAGNSTVTLNASNNIIFGSTLDGPRNLTLAAGMGTISFNGVVGGTTPLTSLTFASAGAIQIGNNITVVNALAFPNPVSVTSTSTITTTNANISFNDTLDGPGPLTLDAGAGTVSFVGTVGSGTPLTSLAFTGSGAIQIGNNITVVGALAFPNSVSLTGASTITTTNANISFNNTLDGAGPLTLDAGTGTVTFSDTVGGTTALTNLTFTSAGLIQIGSSITVSGANPLAFPWPVSLIGTSAIVSNGANISFGGTVNGSNDLALTAGLGNITFTGIVGGSTRVGALTVVSVADLTSIAITATSISQTAGSGTSTYNGNLNTNGVGGIQLTGNNFSINGGIVTTNGGPVLINNSGNLIVAAGSSAVVDGSYTQNGTGPVTIGGSIATNNAAIAFASAITLNSNMLFQTNGGSFSFNTISGTSLEDLTIATGSGLASLGSLPTVGSIGTMTVTAGSILFNGAIDATSVSFTSNTSILNATVPVAIDSTNTAFFNALNGNVGSLSSPILVNTSQQIIAGGVDLADINGTSVDNTVIAYVPNPPCQIIFNGVTIKECVLPPPPPPPTPISTTVFSFPTPGFDDSQFNLASDFYFLPYFLDERYFRPSLYHLLYSKGPSLRRVGQ